jgi:hypothetical protein
MLLIEAQSLLTHARRYFNACVDSYFSSTLEHEQEGEEFVSFEGSLKGTSKNSPRCRGVGVCGLTT